MLLFGRFDTSSQRDMMLLSAAYLWTFTGLATLLAGILKPEIAPDNIWIWRAALGAVGVFGVWSQLTWMRRLDDVRVYRVMNVFCVLGVASTTSLMFGNPVAIAAMFVGMLAPAVFDAHFLSKRAAIFQIGVISVAMVVPVLIYYDQVHNAHVLSRVAAYAPIVCAVSIAVYALRRDRERALEASRRIAMTDPLTEVANLRALEQRAAEVLATRNSRIAGATGLLLIDLDDFKAANTKYGHIGGDHVLRIVGRGLARAASPHHLVARIGGDEFAVLIENVKPDDMEHHAVRYRNAVLAVRKEAALAGVSIDASVGFTSSAGGETLEDLLTAADRAMYKVKEAHRGQAHPGPRAPFPKQLPNEFQPPPWREPDWLTAADLPRAEHATRSFHWEDRPVDARLGAAIWLFGSTIGLFSLAMPDADRTHLTAAVITLLVGYVFAAVAYVSSVQIGGWRHFANDVLTLACIAWIAYLTGGSDSPLWPLVFLFVVYEAWLLDARRVWMRLVGPIAVILLPLAYEPISSIGIVNAGAMYSGVLVAIGVTLSMAYNQYFLGRARDAARALAEVDTRTGLANRREFERRLHAELSHLGYDARDALALVMLDLDDFKDVNSTHGHKTGDRLLAEIGAAIAACARADDCVARVGGDEFAVVIPSVNADTAQMLARRYVDAVAECTARSSLPACRAVTASAGFALYGVHGRTFDDLVSAADAALMSVKHAGKGAERVSSFVVSL